MKKLMKFFLLILSIGILSSCEKEDPLEAAILVPKTVDQDLNLPALEVNGTRLHLETFGNPNDTVFIFLHGGPGGDYRSLLRLKKTYANYSLTDEFFCVFYDQRGAGLSRRYGDLSSAQANDIPELETTDYVADLDAIVNHFSPNKQVVLFGHSWGGMLATEYINQNPDKVAAVILSEPGAFTSELFTAGGVDMNFVGEGLNDAFWDIQFVSDDTHQTMDYNLMNTFLIAGTDPKMHFDLENDPIKFWRYGAAASLLDQFDDYDFTTNLQDFTTKALCINGSLNERLSVAFQQDENMVVYPNFEVKVIENVGHDLIWKSADMHVQLIKKYLDEVL